MFKYADIVGFYELPQGRIRPHAPSVNTYFLVFRDNERELWYYLGGKNFNCSFVGYVIQKGEA